MKTSTLYASFLSTAAAHSSSVYNVGRRQLEDVTFDPSDTALVVIDPQNDFLSEGGVVWDLVKDSVAEHDTITHITELFQAAEENGYYAFISPHYYYPHDKDWEIEGTIEGVMHDIGMFDRAGPLSLENFEGSGADWVDVFKPYIIGKENVVVTNPHKVYGPEANDLGLQMRKRKIDKVILSGMSANLCVESHMRELIEQGFEVFVVEDATAGAKHPQLGDGYAAALTNFRYISNGVIKTDDAVKAMGGSSVTIGGDTENTEDTGDADLATEDPTSPASNRNLKATTDYFHHISLGIGGLVLAVGGFVLAH
ncbi:hypothetical protein ACHAXT_007443 [Thalassiosira profunda]